MPRRLSLGHKVRPSTTPKVVSKDAGPSSFAKALQLADHCAKNFLAQRGPVDRFCSAQRYLHTFVRSNKCMRSFLPVCLLPFGCNAGEYKKRVQIRMSSFTAKHQQIAPLGRLNRPGMQNGSCTERSGTTNWRAPSQIGCYWSCCRDLRPEPSQNNLDGVHHGPMNIVESGQPT